LKYLRQLPQTRLGRVLKKENPGPEFFEDREQHGL